MMKPTRLIAPVLLLALTFELAGSASAQTIDPSLKPEEIKAIAKDAFFWGMTPAGVYEMRFLYTVGNNRVGWNRKRVRASDREINTPNFTTLYGFGVDLNDYSAMGYYGLAALFRPVPCWSHTTLSLFYDADGRPLDGATRYTLTFDVNHLPPVSDFWEIPIYDQAGYFVDNEVNRYAVNSYIYKNGDFVVKDGKLTFYLQKDKPSAPDQSQHWLPIPLWRPLLRPDRAVDRWELCHAQGGASGVIEERTTKDGCHWNG
jgi:hypothetical protein